MWGRNPPIYIYIYIWSRNRHYILLTTTLNLNLMRQWIQVITGKKAVAYVYPLLSLRWRSNFRLIPANEHPEIISSSKISHSFTTVLLKENLATSNLTLFLFNFNGAVAHPKNFKRLCMGDKVPQVHYQIFSTIGCGLWQGCHCFVQQFNLNPMRCSA